ncbi:MAG: MBOAT family O-acyltransferase [Pseudomonadota bacterium]
MVFSSILFLFYFLPVFLFLYYLLPWKNAVLLVASLLFYAWGEPRFVPLLLASAVLNYGAGLAIERSARQRRRWLVAGVAANLLLLAWFKYAGFLNQALGAHLALPALALPLGISFFTFQGLSYLADVYRGEVAAQTSFWRYATYKAMFPQLIAGPIVRYRQIAAEIGERSMPNARVRAGFEQFALGLAQKVLLANTVALPADRLFGTAPDLLSAAAAWVGLLCYTLQIYYDFCGYSNMAIGIGHMTGFTYPPNFDRPYAARSVTEFWQRWHISLSSWFRDYLYIPLGGNRHGALRTYANLTLVFLLCGLWHGAAWTFVAWGAWHGALLVVERMGMAASLARLPGPLAQAWTLLAVMLGWVLFRAPDLPFAAAYFGALFGASAHPLAHPWQIDVGSAELVAMLLGAALALPRTTPPHWRLLRTPGAVAALALCAISLAGGTYNPFIYYRF